MIDAFSKASVRDAEVAGRRVLVRVDFNVPLDDGGRRRRHPDHGRRCRRSSCCASAAPRSSSSPTSAAPAARSTPALSMRPVGDRLAELLGTEVHRAPAVVGGDVETMAGALGPGEVLLLENARFEPGETENDPQLAEALAQLADLYVNDAFGAAHRAHASTEGVARLAARLRRAAPRARADRAGPGRRGTRAAAGRGSRRRQGLRQDRRHRALPGDRRDDPDRRRDELQLLPRPGDRDRRLAGRGEGCRAGRGGAGGGRGVPIAGSSCRATRSWGASSTPIPRPARATGRQVPAGWMGLDIGPRTAAAYAEAIAGAGTVLWNGPMGAFELEPFAAGTRDRRRGRRRGARDDGGRRRRLGRRAAPVRAR